MPRLIPLPASRLLVVAALTVTAFVVAACSGGGSPTQAPPAPTAAATASTNDGGPMVLAACDLLTRDDFVEVLGLEVATAGESNLITAYSTDCEWTFGGSVIIVLGVLSPGGADFVDRTVEYEGGTSVEGLGDRAIRTDTSGSLLVLVGDTMLDLQSIGAGDDVDRVLVERALARLRG